MSFFSRWRKPRFSPNDRGFDPELDIDVMADLGWKTPTVATPPPVNSSGVHHSGNAYPGAAAPAGRTESGTDIEDEQFAGVDPMLVLIAKRAMLEAQAEEIKRGAPFTDAERMVVMQASAFRMADSWLREKRERQLMEDLSEDMDYSVSSGLDDVRERLGRISEQLNEPRDLVGRALKFQKDHPILAGVIGAEIVHKLKKP